MAVDAAEQSMIAFGRSRKASPSLPSTVKVKAVEAKAERIVKSSNDVAVTAERHDEDGQDDRRDEEAVKKEEKAGPSGVAKEEAAPAVEEEDEDDGLGDTQPAEPAAKRPKVEQPPKEKRGKAPMQEKKKKSQGKLTGFLKK